MPLSNLSNLLCSFRSTQKGGLGMICVRVVYHATSVARFATMEFQSNSNVIQIGLNGEEHCG